MSTADYSSTTDTPGQGGGVENGFNEFGLTLLQLTSLLKFLCISGRGVLCVVNISGGSCVRLLSANCKE